MNETLEFYIKSTNRLIDDKNIEVFEKNGNVCVFIKPLNKEIIFESSEQFVRNIENYGLSLAICHINTDLYIAGYEKGRSKHELKTGRVSGKFKKSILIPTISDVVWKSNNKNSSKKLIKRNFKE